MLIIIIIIIIISSIGSDPRRLEAP